MSAPIQYGFEYEVRLAVSIPLAWATLLKEASKHHYDARCREIGESGVINGLYNTAYDGEYPSTYAITIRDLDIIMKVCEQLPHHTKDVGLIITIRAWLQDTWNAIEKQHRACVELPGSANQEFWLRQERR